MHNGHDKLHVSCHQSHLLHADIVYQSMFLLIVPGSLCTCSDTVVCSASVLLGRACQLCEDPSSAQTHYERALQWIEGVGEEAVEELGGPAKTVFADEYHCGESMSKQHCQAMRNNFDFSSG